MVIVYSNCLMTSHLSMKLSFMQEKCYSSSLAEKFVMYKGTTRCHQGIRNKTFGMSAFKKIHRIFVQQVPEMLDYFCFQLTIRDEEVQRLNTKIRQLQSEIRDLQGQLELKDERVSY